MTKYKISVSDALQKLEAGEPIVEYFIDFDRIKIEALDVIKLTKAGVKVPEEAIFYNDEDVADDEAFEGDWKKIDADPIQQAKIQTEVKLSLDKDLKQWVETNGIELDKLIEKLLDGFYRTQKMVSDK